MKSIIFLAVLTVTASAFNLNELKRTMAMVDISTCGCRPRNLCEVAIPAAEMVGFRCGGHGVVPCCQRRRPGSQNGQLGQHLANMMKKRRGGQHITDIMRKAQFAAAKAKHQDQRQLLAAAVANSQQDVDVKIVKPKEVSQKRQMEEEPASEEPSQTSCSCQLSTDCPLEKQYFLFGKSCGFGRVKCCDREDVEKEEVFVEEVALIDDRRDEEDQGWRWSAIIPKIKLPFSLINSEEVKIVEETINEIASDEKNFEDRSSNSGQTEKEEQEDVQEFFSGKVEEEMQQLQQQGKQHRQQQQHQNLEQHEQEQQRQRHQMEMQHQHQQKQLARQHFSQMQAYRRHLQKQQYEGSFIGGLTTMMQNARQTLTSYFY